MKQKVAFKKLDKYDIILGAILTAVGLGLLLFIGLQSIDSVESAFAYFCVLGLVCLLRFVEVAFYLPLSIEVDEHVLRINRFLKTRTIPVPSIRLVCLYPNPGDDGWGIVTSRKGLLGNWGYWKESELGWFFAYYGCSDDCFLIELDNGKKYVLGCANPNTVVDHINTILKQNGHS